MRAAILSIGLAVFLGAAAGAETPAGPTAASLADDTPSAAPGGADFTAPKGWSLANLPSRVVLTAPEGDARIAIVDAGAAKDALEAVADAWRLYAPAAHRPVKLATPQPAREGWDERAVVDYETSPNEHLSVEAVAFRGGGRWTVAIVDASESTAEKRAAATRLVLRSIRPKGYVRETFAGRAAHKLDPGRVKALMTFVRAAMDELDTPGVGLALVEDGRVIFEGGLGVKELGKPDPVDAHTLFMIASNTKGMSTLLLAELADEGKLDWDEPVTSVYPGFRLGSEATTAKVLVRHLVCACTGLPRKDMEWVFNTPSGTPESATFTQLAATEPTSPFGEVFQYNNLMASAAGFIGGHLVHPDLPLGAAYDLAMREKIFAPLGMDETTFDMAKALAGDHASPHDDTLDGKPAVADMALNVSIIPYRPAGGAWSSAHDLIKYVQDEIAQGQLPAGGRLVSARNLLKRREPNVAIGENADYGMGLEVDRAWGVTVVHHGGSLSGFKSDIMLVPDARVGAVILTNGENGSAMLRPFMRRLLEVLYDGKPEAAEDVAAEAASLKAELAKDRERLVAPPAPAAAAALAARYVSPELGSITVRREGADLVFDFGAWKSRVASRLNDDGTTSFVTIDPGAGGSAFVVTDKAGKRGLMIRDGQHAYAYVEES